MLDKKTRLQRVLIMYGLLFGSQSFTLAQRSVTDRRDDCAPNPVLLVDLQSTLFVFSAKQPQKTFNKRRWINANDLHSASFTLSVQCMPKASKLLHPNGYSA